MEIPEAPAEAHLGTVPREEFMASDKKRPLFSSLELPFEKEEEVRQVYRLLPHWNPKGKKGRPTEAPSEGQIQAQLKAQVPSKKSSLSVAKCLDLLEDCKLVETDRRNVRTAWRTERHDYKGDEKALYDPMGREIEERWAKEQKHNYYPEPRRFLYLHRNKSGARGGSWRRPDITLVGGMTLPFLPGKFLDVITFEVKLWSNQAQRMAAMYEALAHRRRATYSYVLYFLPHDMSMETGEEAAITREALRTGVGVIVAKQEDDFDTWQELVEPVRHSPDPHHLHEFVLNLASADHEFRRRLRRWISAEPFLDSATREKLNKIEQELGLHDGKVLDFFQEIPPAEDPEGYGLPTKGKSTCETISKQLNLDVRTGERIKDALMDARLIESRQRGGMRRL